MEKDELRRTLDYIMNTASDGEFEVIVKAVMRRQRDSRLFSKSGGMNPERLAKEMSADIGRRFGADSDSLRATVRGFVADLIRKEAPEIAEADLEKLLDMYGKGGPGATGAAKKDLPPQAVLSMLKQFMDFSTGAMAPSEKQYLWEAMPRWQDEYWDSFEPELKALVTGALKGKIGIEEFWTAVYSILGL